MQGNTTMPCTAAALCSGDTGRAGCANRIERRTLIQGCCPSSLPESGTGTACLEALLFAMIVAIRDCVVKSGMIPVRLEGTDFVVGCNEERTNTTRRISSQVFDAFFECLRDGATRISYAESSTATFYIVSAACSSVVYTTDELDEGLIRVFRGTKQDGA
ncbi:hypothetical protein M514_18126 [Trichuris suis]|uniref:Uncharacterized protein n=1 Tax=Trichuris suis TaxID=68888 RepID=A0A085NJU5_9BILA|nr:hypothetical protein M514_18126 [Trichuris suis]